MSHRALTDADRSRIAFEALYLRLRQEGFRTGVDEQLRLQELLDLADGCRPGDLKTLLCPIFATNPQQQEAFHRIFQELFPILEAAGRKVDPGPQLVDDPAPVVLPERKGRGWSARRMWAVRIGLVAAVAGVLVGVYFVGSRPVAPISAEQASSTVVVPPPPVAAGSPPAPFPATTHTVTLPIPPEVPYVHPAGEAGRIAWQWTAILAPIILLFGYALFRWFLRRARAAVRRGLKGPHYVPIQVEPPAGPLFEPQKVVELARRMRQREDAGHRVLDLPRTLSATIDAHGYPTFRFRAVRRPPEYVVLLERRSRLDHFTALTDTLLGKLQEDGVLLARYYFERNPRFVFSASDERFDLENLVSAHEGYRLLVVGSSECLLDPGTAGIADWAQGAVGHCAHRAVLVTDAPGRRRVARLQEAGLAVFAADLAGFEAAVDFFRAGGRGEGKPFPEFRRALAAPIALESEADLAVGQDGPSPGLAWLAACAVYRDLNWNLTLRLGRAVCGAAESGPVSEEQVSQIARTRWLREGVIPAHWRDRLVARIPERLAEPVRQTLLGVLRKQVLPEDTFAWETWRDTLRAFTMPDAGLGGGWKGVWRWDGPPEPWDLTCLRFLDRNRGPKWLRLPEWLRPWVFQDGVSLLGTRLQVFVVLGALVAGAGAGVWQPWRRHAADFRLVRGTLVLDRGASFAGVPDLGPDRSFEARAAGGSLAVSTPRPYWAESIRMVKGGGGRVEVVVGTTHPQAGPVRILDVFVDRSAPTAPARVLVDYTGPASEAQVQCGAEVTDKIGIDFGIYSKDEGFTLDSVEARGGPCIVTVLGLDGSRDSRKVDVPERSGRRLNARDGLYYVWVPPGTFRMGCSPGDLACSNDEKLARQVTIPKGFWMGQTEITQEAYQKVVGKNPSDFKGDPKLPVENISWNDADAYCRAVGMRLPTEEEWEYAARAGTTGSWYGNLDDIAWYVMNSGYKTHVVGGKRPNAFGLYDMLGNVWEWTADGYADYPARPQAAQGPRDGSLRVLRGGSWDFSPRGLRASVRGGNDPAQRSNNIGARCVGE